jgi:hypothetical protein
MFESSLSKKRLGCNGALERLCFEHLLADLDWLIRSFNDGS